VPTLRIADIPRLVSGNPSAKFSVQHSALTSRICSIVEHDVSRSLGEATMTERQCAREIATLSRLRE
jgi:hypothetical protein